MPQKIKYDWNWVNTQIESIGDQLGEQNNIPAYVTGIPRGGLIPAVIFSHKYDIPFIELHTACWGQEHDSVKERIIIFDDISDTGDTFLKYTQHKFITAALAYRRTSRFIPTLIGQTIYDDHWMVFPWEDVKAKAIQDYLVK